MVPSHPPPPLPPPSRLALSFFSFTKTEDESDSFCRLLPHLASLFSPWSARCESGRSPLRNSFFWCYFLFLTMFFSPPYQKISLFIHPPSFRPLLYGNLPFLFSSFRDEQPAERNSWYTSPVEIRDFAS